MNKPQSPAIQMGTQLDYTRKPFLGKFRANIVLCVINAILKARITRGNTDAVFIAENGGLVLQLKDSAAATTPAAGTIQRFKIIGIQGDYIQCHTYDGSVEGATTINVARQSNVRKSIVNEIVLGLNWSVTYTGNASRTLTFGSGASTRTIQQSLHPTYETNGTVQNGQLWAVQATGGTGVSVAPDWLEIGPPRQWEILLQEVDICQTIAGVPTQKHVLIATGDPYS